MTLVYESLDMFKRRGSPTEGLKIGQARFKPVMDLLKSIKDEIEEDADLEGFLNVGDDDWASDEDWKNEAFRMFVEDYTENPDTKSFWHAALREIGLKLEDDYVDIEETIFIVPELHYSTKIVREELHNMGILMRQGNPKFLADVSKTREEDFNQDASINEELVGKFVGQWQKPGEEIEIYKNPESIKRMGKWNRAISDREGNLYVADDPNTTHAEMMMELFAWGETAYSWYDRDDDRLLLCGWQRYRDGNNFYISETFGPDDLEELADQFMDFAKAAEKKNPKINFIPDQSITDAFE